VAMINAAAVVRTVGSKDMGLPDQMSSELVGVSTDSQRHV